MIKRWILLLMVTIGSMTGLSGAVATVNRLIDKDVP